MSKRSLRNLVADDVWEQCAARLKNEEAAQALPRVFEYIVDSLGKRIDDIRTDDGKAISFFSRGREILTINVTRRDLRIYIHPAAGAYFEPDAKGNVERCSLWETSLHKASGKYRAMSVWVSDRKDLPGVKSILSRIPTTQET